MGAALDGHGPTLATPNRGPAWWRVPLLMLGFVALFAGALAGLTRLGFTMSEVVATVADLHGPLMICGFFGVVIALERAVALGKGWAYAGPLLAGLGSAALLHGFAALAPWLYLGGSTVLLIASITVWRKQRAHFTLTLALAAASFTAGIAAWAAGATLQSVLPWWLAFLVLTIAGERLELTRLMPPSPRALQIFAGLVVLIVLSMLVSTIGPWALRIYGASLFGLAIWLFRCDIARRTVRSSGLTRFIAACLLSGYAWLALAGLVIAAAGTLSPGTPSYDAALHALLLGFVFSMVFGHAPIVFPAVLRVAVPYHATFYAPLAMLQLSLLLRMTGDASAGLAWLRAAGLFSAVALLLFAVVMVSALQRGRSRLASVARP